MRVPYNSDYRLPQGLRESGSACRAQVAWQLRDVPPGLGGFCAIPGSQRSDLSLPRERPTSIDLPQVRGSARTGALLSQH
jgi:hypothetical protein